MRGYELQRERNLERRRLRRARFALPDALAFYDLDDLGVHLRAKLDIGWRHPLAASTVAWGLKAMGFDRLQVAALLGVEVDVADELLRTSPRLAPDAAGQIEAQLVEMIPETPEPGRYQPARI